MKRPFTKLAAIIFAVNKLLQGEGKPAAVHGALDTTPRTREFLFSPLDSLADTTRRRRNP